MPSEGVLVAGAVTTSFDPADGDSLIFSYLSLVRELRDKREDPVLAIRRDDVESLASYMRLDGTVVLELLGKAMALTMTQRRSMALLFAAGAAVLMAGTAAFAMTGGENSIQTTVDDGSAVPSIVAAFEVGGESGDLLDNGGPSDDNDDEQSDEDDDEQSDDDD